MTAEQPLWHMLTGEYPPQPGGVSDYTRLVAAGLARHGDEVHVWAPRCPGETPADPGVKVHRLPGMFGRRALRRLDAALGRERRPFRLLVQYVPHMYGWRGMNLLFCAWLAWQRHARPWLMFHEVAFPVRRQPLRRRLLGLVQHLMASLLVRTANRAFVSIPAWEDTLRALAPRLPPVTWLPIPSTVGEEPGWDASPGPTDRVVLGHFGTFGGVIAGALAAVLPALLTADPRREALLLGRGSEPFAEELLGRHPELCGRVRATGALPPADVAAHLRTCHLLVQPYPDGVSSRRTSVMAGLALGRPVVSTAGELTEPIWAGERLAALAPVGDPAALARAAEGLLSDRDALQALGARGRQGYLRWFSLERTVSLLREGGDGA